MRRRDLFPLALGAALSASPLSSARAEPPAMTVYKSPWCGCCGDWVDHVRAAGFAVEVKEVEDVFPLKQLAGVPDALASCHTASIDGYVIEGHVPAAEIRRLLAERPDVAGLAVPGMPSGSPGMEGAGPAETYQVLTFDAGHATGVYATVRP